MAFASGTLLAIERAGTGRVSLGPMRELVESLQEELQAGPTALHGAVFAASDRHRRYAGEGLQLWRTGVTLAVIAESHQQARGEHRTSAGERAEQGGVRMLIHQPRDLVVVAGDGLLQRPQLFDKCAYLQAGRGDDRRVGGQRRRVGGDFQVLGDCLFAAATVSVVKRAQRRRRRFLERRERRLFEQEGAGQLQEEFFADELERLRKVEF